MKITYLFDPLCGWCYGASPALRELAQLGASRLDLAPTGMFAGSNARPLDKAFADYAWQNDQRIAGLTGQIFSDTYRREVLGATDTMFDSAPATVGIVAVGLTTEPTQEIKALTTLQKARYVDGRDSAHQATVADILRQAGFFEAAQRVESPDESLIAAYRSRVDFARKLMVEFGAEGVPALVVEDKADKRFLPSSALFGSFETLEAKLRIV